MWGYFHSLGKNLDYLYIIKYFLYYATTAQ
jgi:hypothetical protein